MKKTLEKFYNLVSLNKEYCNKISFYYSKIRENEKRLKEILEYKRNNYNFDKMPEKREKYARLVVFIKNKNNIKNKKLFEKTANSVRNYLINYTYSENKLSKLFDFYTKQNDFILKQIEEIAKMNEKIYKKGLKIKKRLDEKGVKYAI